jgi:lipopolysaccharide transport system permease protein/teichoic acid transport system permease protein
LGTIGVLWFVFSVGFRTPPVSGHPFALWISVGIVGWFFLSEAVSAMTHSISSQSFLIKKVVFNPYLIPLSSLLSTFILHLVFVAILGAGCMAFGYFPDLHWLGMLYYLLCGVMLCVGIGYFTSSIAVFFPDMGQIVGFFLQFGFWLTPIFWSLDILPHQYAVFFELNPASYIIQGYRDSLLGEVWFWEKPYLGMVFWALCLCMVIIGITVFSKLKNSFADAL